MRRADRLFQIIQILRTRRMAITACELAERLEISERSVYRDIRDLMASGVPIDGAAGVGYVLRRGKTTCQTARRRAACRARHGKNDPRCSDPLP